MDAHVAILSSQGDLPVSPEIQRALGLHPGSRLTITVHEGQLVATPFAPDEVDALCGSLTSETDLVQELQHERRQDKW